MGKLAQQLGGQSQVKVCEKKEGGMVKGDCATKKNYKCGGMVKKGKK